MSNEALVFVGTLNRATPYFEGANGEGILIFVLDETTGMLQRIGKIDVGTPMCIKMISRV